MLFEFTSDRVGCLGGSSHCDVDTLVGHKGLVFLGVLTGCSNIKGSRRETPPFSVTVIHGKGVCFGISSHTEAVALFSVACLPAKLGAECPGSPKRDLGSL